MGEREREVAGGARGTLLLAALIVAASVGPADAKRAPKPPACPGGRFVVPAPLGAIVVDDTTVSVEGGCTATRARRKLTRTATLLHIQWRKCGALGAVHLKLHLDAATCETLTGRFSARGAHAHGKLSAQLAIPPDALGGPRATLPPGAILVTPDEFADYQQRSDFRSIGPAQTAADAAAQAARQAADEQTVMDFVGGNPSVANAYLGGVDPNDPTLTPGDAGNHLYAFTDQMGTGRVVVTHGTPWFREVVAGTIRKFPTRANQLAVYDDLYAGLAAIDPALAGQYPSPTIVAGGYALADLLALNDNLVRSFAQYGPLVPPPGGLPPPGYPSSCSAEQGAGDGTDRESSGCPTHKPLGVYANMPWPLKFFATCVKDQAARGTCWDFATTGAVELLVAKKHHRWVNLSEQHMNFMMKHLWYPSYYGDGDWPANALSKMIDTGYTYPFEQDWDYNPSYGRTSNDAAAVYTHSCDVYAGDEKPYCSDTNHQGLLVCAKILGVTFCGAVGPPIGTTSGFGPTATSSLWKPEDPSYSLALIFWAVGIFQKPVVFSFAVAPSFYPENANGYVVYHGPHCPVHQNDKGQWICTPGPGCECDIGGHAVLVTGFVDNTDLPAGAPAGSGGGYLIIKNSWGNCYGDAGYAYLPYDWVKAYGLAADVVGDVN
jgi:hypothetical protein